jgi:hypothetical protein
LGGTLPGKVMSVLVGDAPGGIARLFEHQQWKQAADALRADPQAVVEIGL